MNIFADKVCDSISTIAEQRALLLPYLVFFLLVLVCCLVMPFNLAFLSRTTTLAFTSLWAHPYVLVFYPVWGNGSPIQGDETPCTSYSQILANLLHSPPPIISAWTQLLHVLRVIDQLPRGVLSNIKTNFSAMTVQHAEIVHGCSS